MDLFAGLGEGETWNLGVALAIGLLLGAERERHKGEGPNRGPAGIRTFALISLLGGVSAAIGGDAAFIVAGVFVAGATIVSYVVSARTDPGLTTEAAMVTVFLLGALAYREPALAGGLAVAVTILLASRGWLHTFVRRVITEDELHDALIFAAAAFVILPLAPNREVGPYGVLNPFTIWRLAVVVMGISAAGYIAQRSLGPKVGLPLAGLASGFVSSAATVGAMGQRASRDPSLMAPAVAGAVLSTVSTVIQMVIVVGATSPATLREIAIPLAFAGGAAILYGAVFAIRAARAAAPAAAEASAGHAFDLKSSVIFAGTVAVVLFVSAALNDWLGDAGLLIATGAAGFADAHSAGISAASLVASGKVQASSAAAPILAGLTANTLTKAVVAWSTGRGRYFTQVSVGLVLFLVATWAGFAVSTIL
ncbi:MAG: MgtC/SapB family protein [Tepidiformaceae bacterium]